MRDLLTEFVYSCRRLRAAPVAAAVAIFTLAAGIAVTTVLFGSVNSVVFKPLNVPELDHIVCISLTRSKVLSTDSWVLPKYLDELRRRGLGAVTSISTVGHIQSVLVAQGSAVPALVERVDGAYFALFGVKPVIGRLLSADEPDAMVISERLWRTRFGADPMIVGSTARVLNREAVIVGVVAGWFRGTTAPHLFSTDVWIPPLSKTERSSFPAVVYGRLAPGVSIASADAEVRALAARIDPENPENGLAIVPATRGMLPSPMVTANAIFAAAAIALSIAVLLIASANVVNLLLSRAAGRMTELTIRTALGAPAPALSRLLAVEAMAIVIPGAALGFAMAVAGLRFLSRLQLPSTAALVPRVDLTPDLRVFTYAIAATMVIAVLLSLGSGAVLSAVNPSRLLGGSSTSTGSMVRKTFRMNLVSWQLAVSAALLLMAGAFLHRMTGGVGSGASFDAPNVAVGQLQFGIVGYDEAQRKRFIDDLVSSDGRTDRPHLAFSTAVPSLAAGVLIRVNQREIDRSAVRAVTISVSPAFFDILGVRLVKGQTFSPSIIESNDTVIIDQLVADAIWPGSDPIGQRLWLSVERSPLRVVGVVEPVVAPSGPAELRRFVFLPITREAYPGALHVFFQAESADAAVATLRARMNAIDPMVPLLSPKPLNRYSTAAVQATQVIVWLLTALGAFTTGIASIGLYAVMSNNVETRLREFGIRRSLGASRGAILSVVILEGLRASAKGAAAGLVAGVVIVLFIPDVLFGITWSNASTILAGPALLVAMSLVALLPPAWRASCADPAHLMRTF